MTLRARLTAAFLAVVLGPVLLGAVFVGGTVGAVTRARATENLSLGATAVRTTLAAVCQRLRTAAETVAALSAGGRDTVAARQAVERGLAAAIKIEAADAKVVATAGSAPAPWLDCGGGPQNATPGAIAARVQTHNANGKFLGHVIAAEPVTSEFIDKLRDAAGVDITVLDAGGRAPSTARESDEVKKVATTLQPGKIHNSASGLYVQRLDPAPGQPLRLALSLVRRDTQGLYAVLFGVVVLAGLIAVAAAWWLARSTTTPLAEVARAVDKVADGDLDARVPVRSGDEVGRLATTFNRMTREMQAYVQALTASRDQLRGNLGLLGETLSSTHDLDRILEVILQTAMATTAAQAGVVLLVDRDDARLPGDLVGRSSEGLEGRGVPLDELRVRVGEGLLGAVAASGEPQRGRVSRDGPTLASKEPRCRTYIAVPFSGTGVRNPAPGDGPRGEDRPGGRLLGVLALYDRLGHDEFDDADLVTLRTFAGQAAVAVENVLLHEEAQRLSLTDALTGLWNYRYLKVSLHREVERATRFHRTLAVLAMDLDRFKEVNDTYGHAAGDAVLAEFADRIVREVREVDLAFRQGGEEFVVLLPETDALGAQAVAARLGAAIRDQPFRLRPPSGRQDEVVIDVTVSVGIGVYPEHGMTGPQVLEAADEALYEAKAAGRDAYRLATGVPKSAGRNAANPSGPAGPDGRANPGRPDGRASRKAGDGAAAPGSGAAASGDGKDGGTGDGERPNGGESVSASGGPKLPGQSRGR